MSSAVKNVFVHVSKADILVIQWSISLRRAHVFLSCVVVYKCYIFFLVFFLLQDCIQLNQYKLKSEIGKVSLDLTQNTPGLILLLFLISV